MDLGQILADAIVRTHGDSAARWIKPDVDGGSTLDGKFDLKQIAATFLIAVRRAEKDEAVEQIIPASDRGIEV